MRIKKLEKNDYDKYEAFILTFKESLLYYSIKYKNFLEELLSIESNYLMVVDDSDNIRAILPLMQKNGKFGLVINSLPYYGSNGGILAKNQEAYHFLLNHYLELISNVASATYISNPLNVDEEGFDYDHVDTRIGHWTPLEKTDDIPLSLMNSYHSKTRNLVRKAMKLDIKVSIDNEAKDFLYETHVENMRTIGGMAKENFFFDLLEKYFTAKEDYNIYVATLEGKRIGAVLLFYYNNTVEYFTPSVLKEYRNYQSTSLIVYTAMIDAVKQDYKWWNWGGTWLSQDGVYHFKTRFGALDKEYKYYTKINNKDIYNVKEEELLKEYKNFYVIPFNLLEGNC